MGDKNWIEEAHMKKGGLHDALGISRKKKIPSKDIEQALKSKNPHLRHMAQAAKNMRGMHR